MGDEHVARTRAAYDTVAADYARLIPDTRAEHALDLAMIDAFVAAADGPVLDAGCGAGRITRHLADRGVEVRGVDLSPGMVAQARAAHPGLDFGAASLLDLPFADNTFAGVLLWYSVIHLPDDAFGRACAEALRVLRPGGVVLVGSQAGEGEVDLHETYLRHGHDVELWRYPRTATVLADALAAAGAEEVARLERAPDGAEKEPQAVVLARRPEVRRSLT